MTDFFLFKEFKAYARFILEEPENLDKLTQSFYDILREAKHPLFRYYAHLSQDEVMAVCRLTQKEMLENIINDTALEYFSQKHEEWKTNQAEVPKDNISLDEAALLNSCRKQSFIKYLPYFTSDVNLFSLVVRELEQFFLENEKILLKTLVEIHNEELTKTNDQLIKTTAALKAGNKELTESLNQLNQTHTELFYKNQHLASALEELRITEEQLIETNRELEQKVALRTSELKVSEEQIRTITNNIPVLISYIDNDLRYQFVNKTYEEWFKLPQNEIAGRTVWEIIGDKAFDNIKEKLFDALSGRKVVYTSFMDYKNAGKRFVEFSFVPHVHEGKVQGIFALINDITNQKRIEEQLLQALDNLQKVNEERTELLHSQTKAKEKALEEKKKFFNILMQVPAQVSIIRRSDYRFELANEQYLTILEAKESIVGKTLFEVIPDLEPSLLQLVDEVMETGKSFTGRDVPVALDWNKTGVKDTKYFNFIYEPIRDLNGEIDSIMSFGYEVTDQVVARQQLEGLNKKLNEKNKELERTNTDLDNFIYSASHDLKAPVANMEGLVTMMKRCIEDNNKVLQAQILQKLETSAIRLNKHINDLTEISKINKNIDYLIEDLSFSKAFEEVKEDIKDLIENVSPIFQLDFQVDEIKYSSSNLRSILFNLISNAIKYRSPERSLKISIATYKAGDQTVLKVCDNGLGLSEQQQGRLFEMFKRLHSHVEGTGIGLYSIKRIIENNNGQIHVKSELGRGTEFTVIF